MLNLDKKAKLSKIQKHYIKNLGIPKYKDWDSGKKDNNEIKENIKKQLLCYQNNKCVYCGLTLGGTSRPEIEHIAPREKHPEFEYTLTNLAIACQFCNGSSKKGTKETIKTKSRYYNECDFLIVHPYYDDVDKFFKTYGAITTVRPSLALGDREKARFTIECFRLSDEGQVEAREKEMLFELFMKNHTKNELNEALINETSIYV